MTPATALDPEQATAAAPRRRCLVTGEERPRTELVRFVVAPDGAVVADVDGRLPGRGMWTLARRAAVADAVARRLFGRAAKRPVRAAPELAEQVEKLLLRRCIEGLGLARRAGQAVGGFERVREWQKQGWCATLVIAAEASAEGRRKLGNAPVATALRSEELGAAFGSDALSYVAVAPGKLAERIAADVARLAGFREPPTA